MERSRPQSPEELTGVVEGVRAMEALIQAADESQRESSQRGHESSGRDRENESFTWETEKDQKDG